jgi:hypothetical protein
MAIFLSYRLMSQYQEGVQADIFRDMKRLMSPVKEECVGQGRDGNFGKTREYNSGVGALCSRKWRDPKFKAFDISCFGGSKTLVSIKLGASGQILFKINST